MLGSKEELNVEGLIECYFHLFGDAKLDIESCLTYTGGLESNIFFKIKLFN